jgi:Predicted transcriptional regulator with C-terminal CBS domains
MNELARRIKQKREQLGLSQEELAKRLGYKSRSTINKIELGINDIPQSKIKLFADALETSPTYLLGYDHPSIMQLDLISRPDENKIANNLNQIRDSLNISTKQFAEKIGISEDTYTSWENGEETPSYNMLSKIAGILNLSVNFILGDNKVEAILCQEVLNRLQEKNMSIDELAEKLDYDVSDLETILQTNDTIIISLFEDIASLLEIDTKKALSSMVRIITLGLKNKPVSEEDRLREENNELFDQLSTDKKQEALNYLRFLVEHQDQGKE